LPFYIAEFGFWDDTGNNLGIFGRLEVFAETPQGPREAEAFSEAEK